MDHCNQSVVCIMKIDFVLHWTKTPNLMFALVHLVLSLLLFFNDYVWYLMLMLALRSVQSKASFNM